MNNNLASLSSSTKGFGWVLRPYKNKLGIYSLILIFVTFIAFWFTVLLSYQYKRLYFDELKGIYSPMFINARTEVDWTRVSYKMAGIKAVRKESFQPNGRICIDNQNGMGFRPVHTGVRTLDADTLRDEKVLYETTSKAGVWLTSELYEVIFGEPPQGHISHNKISLIAKLNHNNDEFVDPITCETDAAKVELPIIKVIPLQSHAKWLILREEELPKLNMSFQLPRINSIYTHYTAQAELDFYLQLNELDELKGKVLYWMYQLPIDLQLNLRKLEAYFFGFFILILIVASAYLANLYLLTQKKLQQSFYLLRFYAVNRIQFFKQVIATILGFWSLVLIGSFIIALGFFKLFYGMLFEQFSVLLYIKQIDLFSLSFAVMALVLTPLLYVYFHFSVANFNHKWRGIQQ